MSKTVSTRLEEEEIKKLNEISKEEHVDRSGLIRKFILDQMKQHEMRKAAEYYRKGIMSLQEAATAAGVSLYDMMDHVEMERIRPPVQPREEIVGEIHDAIDMTQKMKKRK
jgi:metal-responsive CopG/Arc/MetJ family transcriptional regulator